MARTALLSCLALLWSVGAVASTPMVECPPGTSLLEEDLGDRVSGHCVMQGKWHGPEIVWWKRTGNVQTVREWNSGERHGLSRIFYEDGTLKGESPFRNGQLHGRAATYFANGSSMGLAQYRDGLLEGEVITWYEDGTLKSSIHHVQGREHGRYLLNYPSGARREEGEFCGGEECGTWTRWRETGELLRQGEARGGSRVGVWTSYSESGEPISVRDYDSKPAATISPSDSVADQSRAYLDHLGRTQIRYEEPTRNPIVEE